jgi:uncharacterized protein
MQPITELALITGASSGIGAELARQLAARGVDLILTARRQDRLEELAAALRQQHSIEVHPIVSDLEISEGPDSLADEIEARKLKPTMLINNAGFSTYGLFVDQTPEEIHAILDVNIRAVTILCKRVGHPMARRRRGAILNVASFSAIAPVPRYAVYSGTKAYVVAFSQALRHEMLKRGVTVSVLCPGYTKTEFHDVAKHTKTWLMRATELSVEHVAHAGIRGMLRGQFLIVPGWWYKLHLFTARVLPRTVFSSLSAAIAKE